MSIGTLGANTRRKTGTFDERYYGHSRNGECRLAYVSTRSARLLGILNRGPRRVQGRFPALARPIYLNCSFTPRPPLLTREECPLPRFGISGEPPKIRVNPFSPKFPLTC